MVVVTLFNYLLVQLCVDASRARHAGSGRVSSQILLVVPSFSYLLHGVVPTLERSTGN